jgi:hypothetical protein
LRKSVLMVVGLCIGLNVVSCGGGSTKSTKSGLPHRVLASQGVTATFTFGGLVIINGNNDTLPRISPLPGGNSPGIMAISPSRNIVATVDSSTNTVFAVNTATESSIGSGVRLPGSTTSIVVPTASQTGFAAVPGATVSGFSFVGAVAALNFASSSFTAIAVNNAQTVVSNSTGTQLLVFSSDSDLVTVLFPGAAIPPVDTTCLNTGVTPPNPVSPGSPCAIVTAPSFSRPVNAIVNGNTAYILSCGTQCGGTAFNGSNSLTCGSNPAAVAQACVSVFDLGSLTVTQSIPVDAGTMALLNGSTLYVAGTPPTNNDCAGQSTAATVCGRLDVVDLASATVTATAVITDGYHDRMDLTANGQVFIGSHDCTNIGNVNLPGNGEVRGCLSIYRTGDGSVLIPPDNGDVTGLQGFTTRNVEYVAQDGRLLVYDTTKDILLINDFVPEGSIDIVGHVGDVKAIDFF